MDHQAQAYVAPRRVMAEANGIAPPKPAAVTANGKPRWGGAEVCPRCDKSVIIFCYTILLSVYIFLVRFPLGVKLPGYASNRYLYQLILGVRI